MLEVQMSVVTIEAIDAKAKAIGHEGVPPDEIRVCEVIRYVENK